MNHTLEIPFPALLQYRGRTDIRSMVVLPHGYHLHFTGIAFPPEPVPTPPKPIKVAAIEPSEVIQPVK